MAANNSTRGSIPDPFHQLENDHVENELEVGPNQTVTTHPARRKWGHIKPSHRGQIRLSQPQINPDIRRPSSSSLDTEFLVWSEWRGTSSYGSGFTRALAAANIPVVEVCRPD